MAVKLGNNGKVTLASGKFTDYDTEQAHIYRWEATFSNDEFESTNFRDNEGVLGKAFTMGLLVIRGTLAAFMNDIFAVDTDLIEPLGADSTLTLQTDTGETFEFLAMLSGISVDVNKQGGLSTIDCSFVQTGDLTFV